MDGLTELESVRPPLEPTHSGRRAATFTLARLIERFSMRAQRPLNVAPRTAVAALAATREELTRVVEVRVGLRPVCAACVAAPRSHRRDPTALGDLVAAREAPPLTFGVESVLVRARVRRRIGQPVEDVPTSGRRRRLTLLGCFHDLRIVLLAQV
eukprot:CAMPEP_0182580834 /NCGR_PEP_ID=MMETSP1324-20130603/48213_1 /TAXON_ID=236786 /ORGANISM="Florenciella sp., Strain RCC1587" /LENGTH=154 /DNA_ID=CAMNT_0024797117 /DNA_START=353 /DNA_END=818 /DNA_ORIENTATION=-